MVVLGPASLGKKEKKRHRHAAVEGKGKTTLPLQGVKLHYGFRKKTFESQKKKRGELTKRAT